MLTAFPDRAFKDNFPFDNRAISSKVRIDLVAFPRWDEGEGNGGISVISLG